MPGGQGGAVQPVEGRGHPPSIDHLVRDGAAVDDPDVARLEQGHVPGKLLASARGPVAEQAQRQHLQQPLERLAAQALKLQLVVIGGEDLVQRMGGVPDPRNVIHVEVEAHRLEIGGVLVDVEVQVLDPRFGVPPDDVAGRDLVAAQDLVEYGADAVVDGPHLAFELAVKPLVAAEQVAAELLLGLALLQRLGPFDHPGGELLVEPGRREAHAGDEGLVVIDADVAQQDALGRDIVLHDPASEVLGPAIGR